MSAHALAMPAGAAVLVRPLGADADRRRPAGSASSDRNGPARRFRRTVPGGAAVWQWRDRDRVARQHPGARPRNETAPQFAADIAALDIAADDGVPVLCNPLAGIDAGEIFDSRLARRRIAPRFGGHGAGKKLSAKASVVVDGGGAIGLVKLPADIRLTAQGDAGRSSLRIAVGGDEAGASSSALWPAPMRSAPQPGCCRCWRNAVPTQRARYSRDRGRGAVSFCNRGPADSHSFPRKRKSGRGSTLSWRRAKREHAAIGMHRLRDASLACGIGLAFGHSDAAALERLIDIAEAAGARGFRTAPDRALMIIGSRRGLCRPLSPAPNSSALSCAPAIRGGTLSPVPAHQSVPLRRSPRAPSRRALRTKLRRTAATLLRFIFQAAPRAVLMPRPPH